jgi:hypothetical protein
MPHTCSFLLIFSFFIHYLTSQAASILIFLLFLFLFLLLLWILRPTKIILNLLYQLLIFANNTDPFTCFLVCHCKLRHIVHENLIHVMISNTVTHATSHAGIWCILCQCYKTVNINHNSSFLIIFSFSHLLLHYL